MNSDMTQNNVYLGRDKSICGLPMLATGKVRDIYEVDAEHLLFVTTDRVSAFDVVMNTGIPDKGRVLTAIAEYWFENTKDIIDHHLVSTSVDDVAGLDDAAKELLRGRIMLVKRAKPTSVEWVVRGYIAGSGWKEYQKSQTVCGIPLPEGLALAQRLPEATLTPTTKDEDHDRPLTPAEARVVAGDELYDAAEQASLALFARGTEVLGELGILLADTKFEFGYVADKLILIDEALTPDSSRFWPADEYKTGASPPSFDKQILRDYLETLDWNKEYPAPDLDPAVMERVAAKYLEVCIKITGKTPEGMA